MGEENEPAVHNVVIGEVTGELIRKDVVHGDLVFGAPEPEAEED